MKTKLFLLALYLLSKPASAQTTLTLQASKDAAIGYDDGASVDGANTNYGTATQNAAFFIPGIDPSGINANRALIDFDLSVLPANATLVYAHLNLYAYGPIASYPGHTGSANASTISKITQAWQENLVTWNNQPTVSTQHQVILSQSTNGTQNYSSDVTTLVQDMLANPSAAHGFKLQLLNEQATNILIFASREHSNQSLHPTLQVVYTTSTTTFTPTGIQSNSASAAISFYPNPTSGIFKIDGISAAGKSILLLNNLGQVVKEYEIKNELAPLEIDVTELTTGIYFCRVITSEGQIITHKIVINKN